MKLNSTNAITMTISPFYDSKSSQEIKDYAKEISQSEEFKDLDVRLVQVKDFSFLNDVPIVLKDNINKKKSTTVGVINTYGWLLNEIKQKGIEYVRAYYGFSGKYNPYDQEHPNRLFVNLDSIIMGFRTRLITFNMPEKRFHVKASKKNIKKACTHMLLTMFHEKKHMLQFKEYDNSFLSVIVQIENALRSTNEGKGLYVNHHNMFYTEIDADIYGIEKAIEYYYNHPNDDKYNVEYLKKLSKSLKIMNETYDFDAIFTYFNEAQHSVGSYSEIIKDLSWMGSINLDWYKLLYSNHKLRNMEDIFNDPILYNIDPEFVTLVLSSRYLNEHTDYNTLSDESIDKLIETFTLRIDDTTDVIKNNKIDELPNKGLFNRLNDNILFYKKNIKHLNAIKEVRNEKKNRLK